jgi:hypothetical protein
MANERNRQYTFVILLNDDQDAATLTELLGKLIIDSTGINVSFFRPVGGDGYQGISDSLAVVAGWIEDSAHNDKVVVLTQHSDELLSDLTSAPPSTNVYVGVSSIAELQQYIGIANVIPFLAYDVMAFVARILVDYGNDTLREPGSEIALFDVTPVTVRPTSGIIQGRPGLLSELMAIGLTRDELTQIAEFENAPDAPGLLSPWYESKRQVALTFGAAGIAGTITAFIGDVTVVATNHGVFSTNLGLAAVSSLTALTGGCGLAACYYMNKVRKLASRSLRVQRLLSRDRRSS